MKYGLVGYSGKMGQAIVKALGPSDCVAKISLEGTQVSDTPQVLFDFSSPKALETTLDFCKTHRCPLVIGTTGLSEEDFGALRSLAEFSPVVQSYNFSQAIGLLRMILRRFGPLFEGFDKAVTEIHHKEKKDSPSGTAMALSKDLGGCPINSLRLGGVPGDHSVFFGNQGEVLTFTHRALSREVFAIGAIKAAEFCIQKEKGFYDFEEVLTWGLRT